MRKEIYLGDSKVQHQDKEVKGAFVEFQNEKFYKISNFDEMPDFFMTIVSNSDHWMFISSNGSLTAGRKNRDNALFPYYQVDKIHDYRGITGSRSYCLVEKEARLYLWEPFTTETEKIYKIQRNIYKSIYGNKVFFEEINLDLDICFRYGWSNSEKFGWIKKTQLTNLGDSSTRIEVLDGIRNLLPYGIDYAFQTEYSNLLDAYKKCELLPESKLGLFVLSSIPVDRPEPSEALKATSVWSHGAAPDAKYLISDRQVENFKRGIPVETEVDVRAARGAYYISSSLDLKAGDQREWFFMAEINQDSADVANLDLFIKSKAANIGEQINGDIDKGTSELIKVVASADGLQLGRDELACARHFSNALYNIMRGGVFADNYTAETSDFILYIQQSNRIILDQFRDQLEKLPDFISCKKLVEWARDLQDPEMERIALEYLPLTFSRRHGDPSRPWNQFSIDIKNSDGSDKLNYQGNWRDIFQNWEALSLSYPEFIEGMLSKFLNASTADGYNPYRITREGIDWECADPDDPWSFIGYWGDHQIIYLQKFLEQSQDFHPGELDELLNREIFVFANVPYRIKSFEEIVQNPKDTILFDHDLNNKIEKLSEETGADGRLLRNGQNEICRSNLADKILITMLAKLSNFIPEAGIWLNTQRPEWNDANNALVGNGVSMVTLYYLRRFLSFWEARFSETSHTELEVSEEIKIHLDQTFSIFTKHRELLDSGFSDRQRYNIARSLGQAGGLYRASVYNKSFSGSRIKIESKSLKEFMSLALQYVDQSIRMNRREDGLYHAYNLVSFNEGHIEIRHLYEMLEGQVAVLSSGCLSTSEALDVLDALKISRMFREDQYSYMLYPDRQLPRFVEKNNIPAEEITSSALLQKLLADKDLSVISSDSSGGVHFNGTFRKAGDLEQALNKLNREDYIFLVQNEKELILGIFERIFDHQSFTGRSGTFYGYEGLGSIYWHMVSKLLLAAQECYFRGVDEKADPLFLGRFKDHYYEIKAGIGLYKSPLLYGAFPTDAYSHTPGNAGAKQPGLTGQVKEDVISRMYELGMGIKNGKIYFIPSLLNRDEILEQKSSFSYYELTGKKKSIGLETNQLGFTFCQVPVICTFKQEAKVLVHYHNGESMEYPGHEIPEDISSQIFSRNPEIQSIAFLTP